MRKFTNWDRFKDDKSICTTLGCDSDDTFYCCPDLDGSLCKPKSKLLKENNILEKDLDDNSIDISVLNILVVTGKFHFAMKTCPIMKDIKGI